MNETILVNDNYFIIIVYIYICLYPKKTVYIYIYPNIFISHNLRAITLGPHPHPSNPPSRLEVQELAMDVSANGDLEAQIGRGCPPDFRASGSSNSSS